MSFALYAPVPGQFGELTALRNFLISVLPTGTDVILAQVNRVPEPTSANFCVMTPISRARLGTNIDVCIDCAFTGSIAGNVLTVSAMNLGTIVLGHQLLGVDLTGVPIILTQTSGTPGGIGAYTLSVTQGTVTSEVLACGVFEALEPTQICIQIDVHGDPLNDLSADNSQTITTLFRDSWAVDQFASYGYAVTPLFCEAAKQIPWQDENQQIENRWVIDAYLEAKQVVTVPQAFAAAVKVGLIDVDAAYPP